MYAVWAAGLVSLKFVLVGVELTLVPDADGITCSTIAGILVASCPGLANIETAADP